MAKKKSVKTKKNEMNKQKLFLICLAGFATLTTVCALVLAINVMPQKIDIMAAQKEFEGLPKLPVLSETPIVVWSALNLYNDEMLKMNPDYIGVLRIEGTSISYPVVRGNDNLKYLATSFRGNENMLGALFLDYRCVGENLKHIIIYGHNIQNHLFGKLNAYLDEQYLEANNIITFIENNILSEYEIFSARLTDIDDTAYHLDFSLPDSFNLFLESNGAPKEVEQIITLSTCYGDGLDDRRIIVQGARRNSYTINETDILIASFK